MGRARLPHLEAIERGGHEQGKLTRAIANKRHLFMWIDWTMSDLQAAILGVSRLGIMPRAPDLPGDEHRVGRTTGHGGQSPGIPVAGHGVRWMGGAGSDSPSRWPKGVSVAGEVVATQVVLTTAMEKGEASMAQTQLVKAVGGKRSRSFQRCSRRWPRTPLPGGDGGSGEQEAVLTTTHC